MDSPGVQIKLDPVAPPEAPKSRDVAPGKKRDDAGRNERRRRCGSGPYRILCRYPPVQEAGSSRPAQRSGKDRPSPENETAGQKEGEEALLQANGQLAAGRKRLRQPAIEVQAKETLDHAKELAGAAMKAAAGKGLSGDSQEAGQSAELTKKGALSPAEEALLKEMIQKNGNLAAQKKAAQMTGFVNGEPLNPPRRDRRRQVDDGKGRGGAQESLGRRGGPGAAEAQDRQIGQDTAGLCDARRSRRRGRRRPRPFRRRMR